MLTALLAWVFAACLPCVCGARASEALPDGSAHDVIGDISLAQAIALALKNNPSEAVAKHTELSARQNYIAQRSPLNPTFQYSGLNNSVAPFGGFGDQSNYAFYVTLETSGRWRYRTDQARWEYVAAREASKGARIALIQTVTNAYIALQVAKADQEAEQQNWTETKKLADLSAAQFRLGATAETNAIRAAIALKQEDQNLIRSNSNLVLARQVLSNALGFDAHSKVDAAEPLIYAPRTFDRTALVDLALKNRFELRAGDATANSLRSNVQLERAGYFPDLLLGATAQGDNVQIGFTVPLDLGSVRGSVSKAMEDLKVQQALDQKQRLQVQLDVESAYEALTAADRVVTSLQTQEVPQAEALLRKVQAGFSLGAATILDVLDAQNTLRTARSGLNDAIGAFNLALAQLEGAVGLPLDEISPRARSGLSSAGLTVSDTGANHSVLKEEAHG